LSLTEKNLSEIEFEKRAIDDLELMFNHKSKVTKIVPPEYIKDYKHLLFFLRDLLNQEKLPMHPKNNYLGENKLAHDIYKSKYYLKNLKDELIEKRPEETFARLAAFLAAVETSKEKREECAVKFYIDLVEGHFLPGGRVIAGAGDLYRLKTLGNCFVSMIEEDNIESIYKAAYECARTYSYGGGIGVDMSSLRPREALVHNAANHSTGAVSFMEIYSLTTGLIGQSGRRGALMLTLDVKHPDIFHFVDVKRVPNWVTRQITDQCKWSNLFNERQLHEIERQIRENTQVRFANISMKVTDEFMNAIEEQTKFGKHKLLVYKRFKQDEPEETRQGYIHYSFGIPSKDLENYEFVDKFDSVYELNNFLLNYKKEINEENLRDENLRNIFGDFILKLEESDLAIHYAGDFLLYFNSDQTKEVRKLIKAKELWDKFIASNYKTAEPGLIFWSRMTKYSPSNYVGRPIITTNPCGEISLEDGGACNLSAMNLSRFVENGYTENAKINWELLKESVTNVTRFLDNTITWNMFMNPLEKQRVATSETRRLGLGVMGIADMLNQLEIGYDSDEGLELIGKVMKFIANTAYKASSYLALEKEPSPLFNYESYSKCPFFQESIDQDVKDLIRRSGLRNIALLTIAPTGTTSNVVLGFKNKEKYYVGVSSGVEPIFALYYQRRSETLNKEESSKFYNVFHPTIQAYLDLKNLDEQAQDVTNLEELRKVLPTSFFRTSHFINADKRVEIQGICQRYIDHSISSTVNLPESIKPEMVSSIYFDAWKKGLKGITIYRDGSRYPILSVAQEQTEFQEVKKKTFKVYTNSEELLLKGDEVFVLENGSLSTAYHSIKENHPIKIEEINLETGQAVISNFIEKSTDKNTCEIKIEDGKVIKTCE